MSTTSTFIFKNHLRSDTGYKNDYTIIQPHIPTPASPLTSCQGSSQRGRGCVCCRRTVPQVWACVDTHWTAGLSAPLHLLPGCRAPSFSSGPSSHSSPNTSATRQPTIYPKDTQLFTVNGPASESFTAVQKPMSQMALF